MSFRAAVPAADSLLAVTAKSAPRGVAAGEHRARHLRAWTRSSLEFPWQLVAGELHREPGAYPWGTGSCCAFLGTALPLVQEGPVG